MKHWEIIADNLSRPDGVGAVSQRSIPAGNQSLLQMRTAATEGALLCMLTKSSDSRREWLRTTTKGVGFVKYWEIIAGRLSKAGWTPGCVSAVDSQGRTIWIVDVHRDDGNRFVVHADELLTVAKNRAR